MSPKNNRNLISQTLASMLSFGLFIYFGFPLMYGDTSYFALRSLDHKLATAQEKYDHLLAGNTKLENRNKSFRNDSLSLDILDEQARVVLGFAKPEEREILEK